MHTLLLFSYSLMSDPSAAPWTVAHQVLLSVEFSRQEYYSGLPFPIPGDLPHQGNSCTAGGFFTTEPPGKHTHTYIYHTHT